MQGWFNKRQCIDVIVYLRGKNHVVISIDAEKPLIAFDTHAGYTHQENRNGEKR